MIRNTAVAGLVLAGGLTVWLSGFLPKNLQDLADLATVAGIVGAGIWAWHKHRLERPLHPKAEIEHTIDHAPLTPRETLLMVRTKIRNAGTVALTICQVKTHVEQVLPPAVLDAAKRPIPGVPGKRDGEAVLDFPGLEEAKRTYDAGRFVIERDESDEVMTDFRIPAEVELVRVQTFIPNENDERVGWVKTTHYRLLPRGQTT